MNMSDNRGWCYIEDGVVIYRASSLGSCTRSLTAARLGESDAGPNQTVRAAMAASAEREDEAVELYEERTGHRVEGQQKRVELKVLIHDETHADIVGISPIIVRGHIDGIDTDEPCLLEVKWLSGQNFAAYKRDGLAGLGKLGKKYRIQRNIYGLAANLPVRMVIGNKSWIPTDPVTGEVNDPADQLIISEPYQPDDVDRREIERIVAKVEEFAEVDELPDCDQECREGDAYSEVHLFAAPTDLNDDIATSRLVERLCELDALLGREDRDNPEKRRGLLGEREDIKDELKLLGNDNKMEKFTLGPFTLSVVPYKGREYTRDAILKRDWPEAFVAARAIGKPYRVIILKKAK